jgi:hypothetical protein
VAAFIYAALVPNSFVSGSPSIETFLILTVPIYSYGAYWAFSIRHALAVRRYRRQALGIGLIVLAIWATVCVFVLIPSPSASPLPSFESFLAFYILFIVLFYWIDASVLTARRSDPLLRDVLYWSRIRIPLWIAIIVTSLIPLLVSAYIGIASDTTAFNQLNAGTFGGPVISLVLDVVTNFSVVILICGMIYLPASAIRSKWDRSLRGHFLWFAPASACLFFGFFGPTSGSSSFVAEVVGGLVLVIAGYTLYRSAKALVPLNTVSLSSAG